MNNAPEPGIGNFLEKLLLSEWGSKPAENVQASPSMFNGVQWTNEALVRLYFLNSFCGHIEAKTGVLSGTELVYLRDLASTAAKLNPRAAYSAVNLYKGIGLKTPEQQTADIREHYLTLLGRSYEQAKSYSNLIIVVGYGGFFTLWTHLRDTMKSTTYDFAGALVGISVFFFILWEIATMVLTSLHQRRVFQSVDQTNPQNYAASQITIQQQYDAFKARGGALWPYDLLLTLVPGLSGALLLIYLYIQFLIVKC